jgi:hypothetical protein
MYRFVKLWKETNDGETHSILYKVRSETPERYLFATNGAKHNVYLVTDIALLSADYYIYIYILLSTGSRRRYSYQFEKSIEELSVRRLSDQRTILPFSWEEAQYLLSVLNHLNIQHGCAEISKEEFQFMFWVFGGNARLLMPERKRKTSSIIQNFVHTEMEEFFSGITANGNLSLNTAFPERWDSCCKVISSCCIDGSELCALFERCVIQEILKSFKNGKSYIYHKLKKNKCAKNETWKLQGNFARKVIISKIEEIRNMQPGEFGVPSINNFAFVDLLYKGYKGELIMFNVRS